MITRFVKTLTLNNLNPMHFRTPKVVFGRHSERSEESLTANFSLLPSFLTVILSVFFTSVPSAIRLWRTVAKI